jgi:hypothetical protein
MDGLKLCQWCCMHLRIVAAAAPVGGKRGWQRAANKLLQNVAAPDVLSALYQAGSDALSARVHDQVAPLDSAWAFLCAVACAPGPYVGRVQSGDLCHVCWKTALCMHVCTM